MFFFAKYHFSWFLTSNFKIFSRFARISLKKMTELKYANIGQRLKEISGECPYFW